MSEETLYRLKPVEWSDGPHRETTGGYTCFNYNATVGPVWVNIIGCPGRWVWNIGYQDAEEGWIANDDCEDLAAAKAEAIKRAAAHALIGFEPVEVAPCD